MKYFNKMKLQIGLDVGWTIASIHSHRRPSLEASEDPFYYFLVS